MQSDIAIMKQALREQAKPWRRAMAPWGRKESHSSLVRFSVTAEEGFSPRGQGPINCWTHHFIICPWKKAEHIVMLSTFVLDE